ncbi:BrxA family protein [Variovorax sp. dw_308]|uniref:BrxA family protein n=1 Tax=Variovorax sp. dw_308 TaxID=2721546 RepID=UPI001C48D5FB|nr:BrxA family protein [Variovorax sp. dw_308]
MARPKFYTTQLQAGLGLVEETRLLLSLYETGIEPQTLLARALDSGLFARVTARRLRNVVIECFAPRYMRDVGVARALKRLADLLSRAEFLQLLLIHTARANLILADFVSQLYWPRYAAGRDSLTLDDAKEFVLAGVRGGRTQKPWADGTVRRVGTYLLSCCADYELLSNNVRGPRRIQALRVQDRVAAYLAHDLKFQGLADNQIVAHSDWQLLGLQPNDVRDVLKRLSLQGYLILQAAGEVVHIGWHYKTMEELIDVLARP